MSHGRELKFSARLDSTPPPLKRWATRRKRWSTRQDEKAHKALESDRNVVSLYDFSSLPDGTMYIVLEFVEGRTIADLLANGETLSSTDVADLIGQVTPVPRSNRGRRGRRGSRSDNKESSASESPQPGLRAQYYQSKGMSKANKAINTESIHGLQGVLIVSRSSYDSVTHN